MPHPRLRERAFVLVPLAEIDDAFAPLRDALTADGARKGSEPRRAAKAVTPMPDEAASSSIADRIRRARASSWRSAAPYAVRIARDGERRRGVANAARACETARRPTVRTAEPRRRRGSIRSTPISSESSISAGRRRLEGDAARRRSRARFHRGARHSYARAPHGRRAPRRDRAATDGAPVEYGQPLFLVATRKG